MAAAQQQEENGCVLEVPCQHSTDASSDESEPGTPRSSSPFLTSSSSLETAGSDDEDFSGEASTSSFSFSESGDGVMEDDASAPVREESDNSANVCREGDQVDDVFDPDFVDFASLLKPAKRPTYRDAFEIIKATLLLTDSQCTKMLLIFSNLDPVPDWENFPLDGRSLAKPKPEYLRLLKIRKVVCGLKKNDFVPFHKKEERKAMLTLFQETGHAISLDDPRYQHKGDIVDFDLEKSLLMESPGNLNPKLHGRMLEQVHAARPNLLSRPLLKLVDEHQWRVEKVNPNPLRAKMNLFALKFHADGVQIAKNSVSSECTPLSCAVDSIFPYDPETKRHDVGARLVIPSSMSPVHTVSLYHGRSACGPMEFGAHWKS